MNVATVEDINYLAQQSSGRINMILSGMTALMNDTNSKVASMESQNWFQRMVKTVTGKNKLTQSEIQQNHDKLNAYMSEAIAELYNRNCIDHEVMMSLGTQLNELYADHIQLKQMLGAFVSKLNEKIDSVDNFHMLTTEINQGVYGSFSPIVAVCKIMSQFDNRILTDRRKLDILKRSLLSQEIINDKPIRLTEYLQSVVEISMDDAGQIYLELGTIRGNFMANIILGLMENYHFLPDMARKMKKKDVIIEGVVNSEGLDASIEISMNDIYEDFVNSKIDVKNGLIPLADLQVDSKYEEAERLYLECNLDEAFELFKTLGEKGNARSMYFLGEFFIQPYGKIIKNYEEAKRWRQRGSELGDVLASLNVAYSMPKDSEERKDIFERMFLPTLQLAENGDVFAQNELADLYLSGYGTIQNSEEGIEWLRKSAEAGYWRAMDKLGDCYYNGKHVAQDYGTAIEWYKKGMDAGYDRSYLNMGYCYYYGKGVPEDNAKAKELFAKAYELGNAEAANVIGVMYNKGYGVPVDSEQEFCWIKKSADKGYTQAQCNLGNCYYCGRGTAKDYEEAKKWYKKASDAGHDYATTQIGIISVENGDYNEAVKWFRIAANNGYADAQNRLGIRYDNGQGVDEDEAEAFRWFMKAAEQGHMKAQANVGQCYHYGSGVSVDDAASKTWLRKSAEQGYEVAIKNLSEWYGETFGSSGSTLSSSKRITADAYDFIKTQCELFAFLYDGSKYDVTYALKENLGVLYEEVYLGHDDTLLKNGKNGFIIAKSGIYCRGLFESYTNHMSFEELAQADSIYVEGSSIYADGIPIAYITGVSEERNKLKDLFETIAFYVKVDLR